MVSAKMDKTVVVAVTDRVQHRRYGKTLQRTQRFYAHDEANDAREGDRVAHRRDPPDVAASSAGGSWKCWSGPDDPAGVAPQGRRQLRRP